MDPESDPQQAPPEAHTRAGRRSPFRLSLLLVALLLSLLAYVTLPEARPGPEGLVHSRLALQNGPAATAPTGELAEAFESARPATLRIELHGGLEAAPSVAGIGTGFFISDDGLVLTAYHVVERQGSLSAVGPEGDRYPLTLVGFDAYQDLAVLQAEVRGEVPFLPLAAGLPPVGSEVVAIGNSRGDFLAGRAGTVTELGVDPPYANFASDAMALTAALYPGDSGGPVINLQGEAVGVVSYISYFPDLPEAEVVSPFMRTMVAPSRYASFAVPVGMHGEMLAELERGLQRDVPVIGFSVQGEYLPPRFGAGPLGPRPGVVVGQVAPGGPAERAGLNSIEQVPLRNAQGQVVDVEIRADVIVAVDGEPTRGYYELLSVLYQRGVGTRVTLSVQRGTEVVQLELELAAKRRVFN